MTSGPVEEVIVEMRADDSKLQSDIESGGRKAGGRFSKAFKGGLVAIGAGVAVGLVGGFLKDAIGGASDLQETMSKTKVVFKGATREVLAFAKQGAGALGLSKQAALDAAATFGTMGKVAGLSGKDLSGFSTDLTSLAVDMASFGNTTPEEAITALSAALRGESEPIRRYGVLLDDATLKAEAMRLGLIKTTKEALTPQQKVLAAQAAIMKQTGDAQGDFARTSDGLANQQRILKARFEDFRTSIGQAFLPAASAAVGILNDMFAAVGNVSKIIGPVKRTLAGLFDGVGGGGDPLAGIRSSLAGIGEALAPVGEAVRGFFAGLMPTLQGLANTFMSVLMPGIRMIADLISSEFLPAFTRLLPILQPVAQFLLNMFGTAVIGVVNGFIQVVKGVITAVTGVVDLIVALANGEWGAAWEALKSIAMGVLNTFIGAFRVWWNLGVLALFKAGAKFLLHGIWKGLWTGFKAIGQAGLNAGRALVNAGLNAIKAVFMGVLRFIGGLWRGFWLLLRSLAVGAFRLIRAGFVGFAAAVRSVVTGLITGVKNLFRTGLNFVVDTVRALPGKIAALGPKFLKVGGDIIRAFINGIKKAGGFVGGIAGNIWAALRGLINNAISSINRFLEFTIPIPAAPDVRINPPDIPRLAGGTYSLRDSGPVLVGENGPELWHMPAQSRVRTASETAGMMGGPAAVIQVHLPTGDPMAAAQAVADRWVLAGIVPGRSFATAS